MIGSIARSARTCPFYNLALDEVFLKEAEISHRKGIPRAGLLGYYNTCSVIVGRYQNQYMESNVGEMKNRGIELVRRRSGGGTVYHDPGCLCFSIVTPRPDYKPQRSIEVIAQSLKDIGATDVSIGERHDLWIGEDKICGSAFRLNNEAAYHHGTLLFDTKLSNLKGILQPNNHTTTYMKGKSVPSVRSPVINISDRYPEVGPKRFLHTEDGSTDFFDALERNWKSEYGITEVDSFDFNAKADAIETISSDLKKLVISGTPKFTHSFGGDDFQLDLSVSHGIILNSVMSGLSFQGQGMPNLAFIISKVLECDTNYTKTEIFKSLDLAVIQMSYSTEVEASDFELDNATECVSSVKEIISMQGL